MFTSWTVLLQCNGCRSFVFHMVRKHVLLKVCFPATLVLHGINSPNYINKKEKIWFCGQRSVRQCLVIKV